MGLFVASFSLVRSINFVQSSQIANAAPTQRSHSRDYDSYPGDCQRLLPVRGAAGKGRCTAIRA